MLLWCPIESILIFCMPNDLDYAHKIPKQYKHTSGYCYNYIENDFSFQKQMSSSVSEQVGEVDAKN